MIKKLDSYLLINYPIIWNTKVIPMLLVAAIIHFCFYLMGLFSTYELIEMHELNVLKIEYGIYLISVLSTFLFLVFRLLGYLKNNAFKKIYPHSKKLLFLEFILIFILIISSIFYFKSYETGKFHNLRLKSNHIDLDYELSVKESAENFLPYYLDNFCYNNSCDSLIARNGYRLNNHNDLKYGFLYIDGMRLNDGTPIYSFLYKCDLKNDSTYIVNKEKKWLINNNKDSIQAILNEYLTLNKKYGGMDNLDVSSYLKQIFKHPDFLIEMQIGSYYDRNNPNAIYVDDAVANSVWSISKSRKSNWDWEDFIALISFTLVLSILLFSFRLTDIKTWFVSLIGGGVLIVLLSVIFILITDFYNYNETMFFSFALIVALLILVFAYTFVNRKRSKIVSGVLLSWYFYVLPFILPNIIKLIREAFFIEKYKYIYEIPQHPVVVFIDDNFDLFFYSNLTITFFAIAFLIIPMAYKWRSNPEE